MLYFTVQPEELRAAMPVNSELKISVSESSVAHMCSEIWITGYGTDSVRWEYTTASQYGGETSALSFCMEEKVLEDFCDRRYDAGRIRRPLRTWLMGRPWPSI